MKRFCETLWRCHTGSEAITYRSQEDLVNQQSPDGSDYTTLYADPTEIAIRNVYTLGCLTNVENPALTISPREVGLLVVIPLVMQAHGTHPTSFRLR